MAVSTFLIPALLCVLLLSCRHHPQQTAPIPLRDSLVRQYLHGLDSVGNDDTASTSVRVLKAYLANDTGFLKKFDSDRIRSITFQRQWSPLDSCIHQPRLQDMGIDEGYRFIYSQGLSPYRINITVIKVKDSMTLHYILYANTLPYDSAGLNCKIKKEGGKSLTHTQWEKLVDEIKRTDFWALSPTNNISGLDGDDIIITGYRRSEDGWKGPHTHQVYRWLVASTCLDIPYSLAIELAGGYKDLYDIK